MPLCVEPEPTRLSEIASLLAKVYLRMQRQSATFSAPQNVADSTANCLACEAESSLTVHTS